MDFIVANIPILICVLAGMALVVVEIFMPGFGLPGIAGIVMVLVAIGVTLFNYGMLAALGMTLVVIAILAIVVSVALKSAARGALSKSPLVLNDVVMEGDNTNYDASVDMQVFVGRTGETTSVLRPVGIAEFDGVRLNVVTEGDYIDKHQPVVIVRVEGSRILVRKA